MKSEIRVVALEEVESLLSNLYASGKAVKARVGKKDVTLFKTETVDESGLPVWVELSMTVKNNAATKTAAAFDADAAIAEYSNHQTEVANAPKKKTAAKGEDAEVAARKAARMDAIRQWAMTDAVKDKSYTATELYTEVGEILVNSMIAATTAKALVQEGIFDLDKEDGKTVYVVR